MIVVLYGTQLGNSHRYAKRLGSHLTFHQEIATAVHNVASITSYDALLSVVKKSEDSTALLVNRAGKKEAGSNTIVLVFIVSTFGLGVPPTSCIQFDAWLNAEKDIKGSSPLDRLEKDMGTEIKFSVLALGDKCHPDFCTFGIKLDDTLTSWGKERSLMKMGILDADESFEHYEKTFINWRHKLIGKLKPLKLNSIDPHQAVRSLEKKFEVKKVSNDESRLDGNQQFNNIYPQFLNATVEDIVLMKEDVLKMTLSFDNSDAIHFSPVASVRLMPENDPEVVKDVASKLHLDLTQAVCLTDTSSRSNEEYIAAIKDILQKYLDLNALPNPDFLEQLHLFSPNSKIDFVHNYPKTIHESIVALDDGDLETSSSTGLGDLNTLLGLLPEISYREYTVANDPQNEPSEKKSVELCVRMISDVSKAFAKKKGIRRDGITIPGLTSRYLLRILKNYQENTNGKKLMIPAQVATSVFSNIDYTASPDARMKQFIIISTGTGVTVATSILKHIIHLSNLEGSVQSKVMVFLGFRNAEDFLYEDFLRSVEGSHNGVDVELVLAYSKEKNSKKVYVQRKLQAMKPKIKGMFAEFAAGTALDPIVCVAGNSKMVWSVKGTFKKIIGKDQLDRKLHDQSFLVEPYN